MPRASRKVRAPAGDGNGSVVAGDTAALQARVAELEALEADRQRALKVEDALYRIADTASSIHDMAEFYPAMHAIVGELMNAENFYIALYDERAPAPQLPLLRRQRRPRRARPDALGADRHGRRGRASRPTPSAAASRSSSRKGTTASWSRAAPSRCQVRRPRASRAGSASPFDRGSNGRDRRRPGLRRTAVGGRQGPADLRRVSTSRPRSAVRGPSRRRASAMPSWPSSTRSAMRWPGSSTSRPSSTSSATASARSSPSTRWPSCSTTRRLRQIELPLRARRGRPAHESPPISLGEGLTLAGSSCPGSRSLFGTGAEADSAGAISLRHPDRVVAGRSHPGRREGHRHHQPRVGQGQRLQRL